MHDIFFISYQESNAEANLEQLRSVARKSGGIVQQIHGVKGIGNAHRLAAKRASTEHFFIIDGDNFVFDNFKFDIIPDLELNKKSVHVWRCLNPVNHLVYGFGGVKLFPTVLFESTPEEYLDFTMAIAKSGYFVQKDLASETRFNVTPFESWKGGFRECVKLNLELHKQDNPLTRKRVDSWTTLGKETLNGEWAMLGAQMGCEYSDTHLNNQNELKKINDFEWLKEKFNLLKL